MGLSREMLARRIRDALRAAGMSQQQLAMAAHIDPTALSKALAGRRDFKSLEVALIAEHLGISTDALLADEGAAAPSGVTLAARMQTDTSPAVDAAVARAQQMRELDSLLEEVGRPARIPPSFPPLSPTPDPIVQGEQLAAAVRDHVGDVDDDLPAEPDDFATWLEDRLGLEVCIAPLSPGLDGLALTSGRLRLVLISSGISATRQRFTLAHEVCHLVAGDAQDLTVDEDVFGRRTDEERRANAFAAAFLMPAALLRATAGGRQINEDLIIELLGRFRVSLDALAFRLHNVGLVNASGRDRVRAMSSARIALRPGRADDLQARDERRAPSRLLSRAVEAFAVGDLGIRPLAALLDTDADTLLSELSPPRFNPRSTDSDEPVYAL
jgi:Zn-dependent peptidase ImmA (M78 family)/transcriptional regulator with XRE-family HTH domain